MHYNLNFQFQCFAVQPIHQSISMSHVYRPDGLLICETLFLCQFLSHKLAFNHLVSSKSSLNSWIQDIDTRIASYSSFEYSSRQVLMLSCNIPSLARLQISPLERLANTTKSAKEIGSIETHPAFSKCTFSKKRPI